MHDKPTNNLEKRQVISPDAMNSLNWQIFEPKGPSGWEAVRGQLRGVEVTEVGSTASVESALECSSSVVRQFAAEAMQAASTAQAASQAVDVLIKRLRAVEWLQQDSIATRAAAQSAGDAGAGGASTSGALSSGVQQGRLGQPSRSGASAVCSAPTVTAVQAAMAQDQGASRVPVCESAAAAGG